MAISKIIPIKVTLRLAIDYIMNPEKTDGRRLVSSFGCSPQTADLEMKITRDKGSGNGERIAYHMIQSFSPEDNITPEKAHELGTEFIQKITGGRHEFVISTHTDGDSIHNHIIFNSVNFIDYKKYDNTQKDLRRMRSINDKICRENDLSVIEKTSGRRGKGKYEYEQSKVKKSWKDKLSFMIDATIQKVSSFEEFITVMEMEGYEVKYGNRKHIAFRSSEQGSEGRFIRGKRIGPAYTEEAIRERIEHKEIKKYNIPETEKENGYQKEKEQENSKTVNYEKKKPRINLIIDISKNLKAQQSKGYEHALVRKNIDTLIQTMNYLIANNLKTMEDFEKHYNGVQDEYKMFMRSQKKISSAMLDISEKIKFTQNYKNNKYVYLQSLKTRNKAEFYRGHEREIILYKASLIYFEREKINPEEVNLAELFEEYRQLKDEKIQNNTLLGGIKEKFKELEIIKKNLERALNAEFENETEQEDREGNNREEQEKY